MTPLDPQQMLHDPLVLFVLGAVYVLGRDAVAALLRWHAKKLREDSDPKNDGLAAVEESVADNLAKLPGPRK